MTLGQLTVLYLVTTASVVFTVSSEGQESSDDLAHVVRKGESLWTIARHYQIDLSELKLRNPGINLAVLGQTLRIPHQQNIDYEVDGDLTNAKWPEVTKRNRLANHRYKKVLDARFKQASDVDNRTKKEAYSLFAKELSEKSGFQVKKLGKKWLLCNFFVPGSGIWFVVLRVSETDNMRNEFGVFRRYLVLEAPTT